METRTHHSTSDRVFHVVCVLGIALPLVFGTWFVLDTCGRAWSGLSDPMLRLGLLSALVQSARVVGLALVLSLPVGIGAAIHLEYLASQGFFSTLTQRAFSLLAAIPSVLYGLLGLTVFTVLLRVRSLFATASITLALFLFPAIVEGTRRALQTVSPLVHEAALALGADPWRALVHVVLPLAVRKLAAEVLLLVSRALGTVAPLLVIGLLPPVAKVALVEPLAVLIFDSVADPNPARQPVAAAGIMVLLLLVAMLHLVASWLARPRLLESPSIVRGGSSGRGGP